MPYTINNFVSLPKVSAVFGNCLNCAGSYVGRSIVAISIYKYVLSDCFIKCSVCEPLFMLLLLYFHYIFSFQ